MKKYKVDIHVHTKETSGCGKVNGKDIVNNYLKAGYDTIVITDHYHKGFFEDEIPENTWNDKMQKMFKGYEAAYKAAKGTNLTVLPGIEMRFTWESIPNEYLIYGIDKEFTLKYPELYDLSIEEFAKFKIKNNLIVIQAHPCRQGLKLVTYPFIDGYEIFNGSSRHNSNNNIALKLATKTKLKMIATSDYHEVTDLKSGMFCDIPIKNFNDLSRAFNENLFKSYIAYGKEMIF